MNAGNYDSTDRLFSFVSLGCVIVGVVTGFWLLGSPGKQRLISLDRERISDLQQITYQLGTNSPVYSPDTEVTLPEQLPEQLRTNDQFSDPATGEPYEYRRLSERTYELCATFSTSSENDLQSRQMWDVGWQHPEGRHCFELDINGQPVSTNESLNESLTTP